MVTLCQLVWVSVLSSASSNSKNHRESLVEQRRQVQVEMEEMWGGGFEGREQGAEWSRRGRNSAVGCISVSRSDG